MKNPIPVFFILSLTAILFYGFYMAGMFGFPETPSGGGAAQAPSESHSCKDGQTQYCRLGNCSGVSVCSGGNWGGCRWDRICAPGSKATCLKSSCPYAIKECNECGTGYGPCIGINASGG